MTVIGTKAAKPPNLPRGQLKSTPRTLAVAAGMTAAASAVGQSVADFRRLRVSGAAWLVGW